MVSEEQVSEVGVTGRARRVLVIDDDPDLLDLVSMLLEAEGYVVDQAGDGSQGLDAFEHTRPDLILLDMKMPVMDGWAFARELARRCPNPPPIVVITAADDARARAAEISAAGWIGKPFEVDTLLATVRTHGKPRH